MAHAVHAVHQQVVQGRIASEDVTADTIEQKLYTQVCPTANSAFNGRLLTAQFGTCYACHVTMHASNKICNTDFVITASQVAST